MSILNIINGIVTLILVSSVFYDYTQLTGALVFALLFCGSIGANWLLLWLNQEENPFVASIVANGKDVTREQAVTMSKGLVYIFLSLLGSHLIFRLYGAYPISDMMQYGDYSISDMIRYTPQVKIIAGIAVNLFLVFYCLFAVRFMQDKNSENSQIKWYRAFGYLAVCYVVLLVTMFLSQKLPVAEAETIGTYITYIILLLFLAMAFLSLGTVIDSIKGLWNLKNGKSKDTVAVPFLINLFAAESSIKSSFIKTIEDSSGVNISHSEIIAFVIGILEPTLIISIIAVWLSTSMVMVPPDKQAIFKTFGNIEETRSALPGAYLKYPWPISTVDFYSPEKIRTINIGFEPDPTQDHLIWTKSHALKNFYLVVGDGVELIAVDCQIMYKVNDLYKYVTSVQNPEEYIAVTAYELITQATISSRFDDIVSQDRNKFSNKLKTEIQAVLDKIELGVSIEEVVFLTMHPPLEIADVYEDAISAQIDKLTYFLSAKTENTHRLFLYTADAKARELRAKGDAATTLAQAAGDAAAFISRSSAFNIDPELTKFRLKLDRYQELLSSKPLYVVDKSLLRDKDSLFFSLKE